MAKQTLPISERSLIRRINRKLAEDNQLKKVPLRVKPVEENRPSPSCVTA